MHLIRLNIHLRLAGLFQQRCFCLHAFHGHLPTARTVWTSRRIFWRRWPGIFILFDWLAMPFFRDYWTNGSKTSTLGMFSTVCHLSTTWPLDKSIRMLPHSNSKFLTTVPVNNHNYRTSGIVETWRSSISWAVTNHGTRWAPEFMEMNTWTNGMRCLNKTLKDISLRIFWFVVSLCLMIGFRSPAPQLTSVLRRDITSLNRMLR